MALTIDRTGHGNPDILQLGCLRYAPVERREGVSCRESHVSESVGMFQPGDGSLDATRVLLAYLPEC
jgi:hypothetical protein